MKKFVVKEEREFWKNSNFWTAFSTLIIIVSSSLGYGLQEDLLKNLVDSIFPNFNVNAFVVALITLGNSIYQIFLKKRRKVLSSYFVK